MASLYNFQVTARNRQFIPFKEEQKTWQEPFYFIQAADTQLGMQERYIEGREEGYGWSQEVNWTKQMITEINAMVPQPKFLVVCGDLLDAWPATWPEIRKEQEKDLKQVLAGLQVPLVCVCGNHDVGNTPTPETVDDYVKAFGDDYFSFWCGGCFFMVLNSQYLEDSSLTPQQAAAQDAWLEQQLQFIVTHQPRHTIMFQHIPWFVSNPEEDKSYFNIELGLRQAMLERLYEAGVRHVYCGHLHRNAGGFYRQLEVVVTSAVGAQLGDDGNGYRVVKVLQDRLCHQYYALGTAPTNVHLTSDQAT